MTQELITNAQLVAFEPDAEAADIVKRDIVRRGVSQRIVSWTGGRDIAQRKSIVDYIQTNGTDTDIVTDQWPIENVTIKFDDSVLAQSVYRVNVDGYITRINGSNIPIPWSIGQAEVTYDGGYSEIPADLVQLCAMQCVAELMLIDQKFLGLRQRDPESGATLVLERGMFLPQVEEGIRPYRRLTYGF